MAIVKNQDYSLRRGKLEKNSPVVYRVRNGKQQSYIPKENTAPPSKAQTAHRKLFGKVTALVNAIMADPAQKAQWDEKRQEYNRSIMFNPAAKRYRTTRSFAHFVISTQLEKQEAAKRRRKPIKKALPKGLKLHIRHFADLSVTELYEILKARFAVFYLEQQCRCQDLDDVDYQALHFALHSKGRVIAYARLFPGQAPGEWRIGRLLTLVRGEGFGIYMMEQAESFARRQGATSLLIHAQAQTAPFYEKLGFRIAGDIFLEAGVPHIQMIKQLL